MNQEPQKGWREVVDKLREPSNWLKQPRGEEWKSVTNVYDRTPFEAADLIESLTSEREVILKGVAGMKKKDYTALCGVHGNPETMPFTNGMPVRCGCWEKEKEYNKALDDVIAVIKGV